MNNRKEIAEDHKIEQRAENAQALVEAILILAISRYHPGPGGYQEEIYPSEILDLLEGKAVEL